MKKKIGILFGGKSGEHEVSLRSAASVVRHLDANYEPLLIGIDPQGFWYLQQNSYFKHLGDGVEVLEIRDRNHEVQVVPGRGLFTDRKPLNLDIVFPVLHGSFGEDGTVQGLLEMADLPYVGAGVLASALAMDKEQTKIVWRQAGLQVVDYSTILDVSPEALLRAQDAFPLPVFVKPSTTGSSVGISRVENPTAFAAAVKEAFRYADRVLVEPAVEGREIECAVLGNRDPQAFAPGEIVPSDSFYSYQAKYIDPEGAALIVPAEIPEATQQQIKDAAVSAYRVLGCSGLARVDFFLQSDGTLLLNEINTLPGFTNISMYPKMCAISGLPYPQLLDSLIRLGLERYRERKRLRFIR